MAIPRDMSPTTADIHLYQLKNPWSIGHLRFLDMEGFSASPTLPRVLFPPQSSHFVDNLNFALRLPLFGTAPYNCQGLRWDIIQDEGQRREAALRRNHIVDTQYPRLAYFISDILVFVVQGDLAVASHAQQVLTNCIKLDHHY